MTEKDIQQHPIANQRIGDAYGVLYIERRVSQLRVCIGVYLVTGLDGLVCFIYHSKK